MLWHTPNFEYVYTVKYCNFQFSTLLGLSGSSETKLVRLYCSSITFICLDNGFGLSLIFIAIHVSLVIVTILPI